MANVKIQGNASGSGVLTITAPNTDATRTITLPDSTGSIQTVDGESYSPRGLICSNDTDAAHDVAISVGGVKDATNTVNITLAAILTKRIDAAWAVGDNNGGLDGTESSGGTPDASTLYYVWLIKRSDTGVVDALYSESATGPTLPTNYDYKRLIGAVMTDGSANILPFVHVNDYFRFVTPITDVNDATMSNDAYETGTASVPRLSLAHIYGVCEDATGTVSFMAISVRGVGDADVGSTAGSFAGVRTTAQTEGAYSSGFMLVDASSQFEYAVSEAGGTVKARVYTFGFTMLTRSNP